MVLDDVYSMVGGRWGIMKREYRGGRGQLCPVRQNAFGKGVGQAGKGCRKMRASVF